MADSFFSGPVGGGTSEPTPLPDGIVTLPDVVEQFAIWPGPKLRIVGSGPPSPTTGVEGDFYLDTSVFPPIMYGPKGADNSWPGPFFFSSGWQTGGSVPPEADLLTGPDLYLQQDPGGALIWGPRTIDEVTVSAAANTDLITWNATDEKWEAVSRATVRDSVLSAVRVWNQVDAFGVFFGNQPPDNDSPGQEGEFFWYDDGDGDTGLYRRGPSSWFGPLSFTSGQGYPEDIGEELGQYFIFFSNEPATQDGDISLIFEWVELYYLFDYARRDRRNQFNGGQQIYNFEPDLRPLTIQGAAGQTASLLLIETNGGTARLTITDAGYLTVGGNVQSDGGVRVGTAVTYTTNQRWVSVGNAVSVPSTVSSGAIAYAEAGELRVRTPLANVGLTAKRVTVKTAAHTFEGADQGSIVVLNDSTNRNFTIPEDASVNFPIGTEIQVATQSTGHITVVGSGAATVAGTTTLNQVGQIGTLIKVAANTWLISA
jgi:hypothetical protein